jgi:hypothetical protein
MQSCAIRHPLGHFQVVRDSPDYLLRSPDAQTTPFRDVLTRYNSFVPGKDWLDLRPQMQFTVENAYYKEGAPKRGLPGFLGTQVAQYRVRLNGHLQLLSIHSAVAQLPRDQPPVQQLISARQRGFSQHRFFFEILFKQKQTRGSVIVGAASLDEINRLAARLLTEPDAVCGAQSPHCTVFPEACSVSLESEIVVNSASRTVPWGSLLSSIAEHPHHLELSRLYGGRLIPVQIDPNDPAALRLPLLPGDRIIWN